MEPVKGFEQGGDTFQLTLEQDRPGYWVEARL